MREAMFERSRRGSWSWRLPDEPHVPGQNIRPPDADISRIARTAPRPTNPATWRDNEAYLAGLRLYAHGYYWEAHEVWEPVWMHAALRSQERELTQGLIQLANAALKLKMDQPKAARRLAAVAERHFREAGFGEATIVMSIDLAAIAQASRRFIENLDRGGDPPAPIIPLLGGG